MYQKFWVSLDTGNDFMRLFVNRNVYGVQAINPLPNGSVPYFLARDRVTMSPMPLNADVVRLHMNGDITINLFAINPATQRSKWVAIDADFDDAMRSLIRMQEEMKQDGVEAALEQSRRGGHLWVFCETPLLAAECRIYIYNLALRLGIPVKCGGHKDGIEIFPRQDRLDDGEYGNAIRAPLGVHRKTNLRYWFREAAPRPEAQLAFLNGLPKLREDRLKSLIDGMSFPEVIRPVAAVSCISVSAGQREFRILDHIRATRKDSRNWWARCPSCAQIGHDRTGDNLSIQIKDSRFYKCWAGCTKEEIRSALGQPICLRRAA
jgi:hypothetical protein